MPFSRDPSTKEELLDRMLRYDFKGDIRELGAEEASLTRLAANRLQLRFPKSGKVYELTVHRPRHERELDRPAEDRSWSA
jgi:hypothetical protein